MSETAECALLEMKGIGKSFPGVQALEGVNLSVRAGEVHALLGENGAGKSTLIKILSGAYVKDAGEIEFDGRTVEIRGPQDAQALGISTIYQEFNLAPHLTVPENIFLGHLPRKGLVVDWAEARVRSQELLARLGTTLPMDAPVATLSVAQQQLVEIAKALARETRVLVMDEPSAVLGEQDLDSLFAVVRVLRDSGIAIIYISHRLKEIFEVADKVTVLKDGRYVGTRDVSAVTMNELVRMMIGRNLEDVYPQRDDRFGDVLLDVRNITRPGKLHDIAFQLRAGEIVGFAGITGSGRTEVARALFGADPSHNEIFLYGSPYKPSTPADAIHHRVALVTEDRKAQGLFLQLSVTKNITISGLKALCRAWIIQMRSELDVVQEMIKRLRIKAPSPQFLVGNMSGGNQQKTVVARWLSIGSRVFILDEPTRGIDVGSKSEIYQIMAELTARGAGIVMISSELPEILGMSDRVMVMREGRLVKQLARAEASEEKIMSYALGTATD